MEGAVVKEHADAREFARVADEVARYGHLNPEQLSREIDKLERQMYEHARNLDSRKPRVCATRSAVWRRETSA